MLHVHCGVFIGQGRQGLVRLEHWLSASVCLLAWELDGIGLGIGPEHHIHIYIIFIACSLHFLLILKLQLSEIAISVEFYHHGLYLS